MLVKSLLLLMRLDSLFMSLGEFQLSLRELLELLVDLFVHELSEAKFMTNPTKRRSRISNLSQLQKDSLFTNSWKSLRDR